MKFDLNVPANLSDKNSNLHILARVVQKVDSAIHRIND